MVVETIIGDIKSKVSDILSKESVSKIVALGTVDDYCFKALFNDKIIDECSFFISIDKKYTTYKMIEGLLESKNVYLYNNNLHKNTKKENIIFSIHDDEIEMLFSGFEFTKDNLDNSNSVSIYVRGNKNLKEMCEVIKLCEYYSNNQGNYIKLGENILNELKIDNSFRNDKINTIFEEMQIDEVISSFRNKATAYKNIYENKNEPPMDEEIDIEINID